MTIQTNGNVGIGTNNASVKLDVVGSATFRNGTNTSSRGQLNVVSTNESAKIYMRENDIANGILFEALQASPNGILIISQDDGISIKDRIKLTQNGTVAILTRATDGSEQLCRNSFSEISDCSSSIRYKQNINPFVSGLSLIRQLRPVSFNWRANNQADFGLVAEEVNQVEPLLTTTNAKGEIEGVKYDRVGVVLVNAVQEQQLQLESQQKQLDDQKRLIKTQDELMKRQQTELEVLKILVCSQNPTAETCKPKK